MDIRILIFLLELVSSIISFIVGYYALKAYRTTATKGLLLLYLGFTVLGIGTLLRFTTAAYVGLIVRTIPPTTEHQLAGLIRLAASIYMITQLLAYGLFTITYILQAINTSRTSPTAALAATIPAAAAGPFVQLFFIPQLELIAITLLGFITIYTFTNWLIKKETAAALVTLGFGLMLLSHFFFLLMINSEAFLFLGQISQLAGFLCLLTMLAKVSKTNA